MDRPSPIVHRDLYGSSVSFDRPGWIPISDDGNVTKLEFDTTWRQEDFNDKDRAPLFFLEMDRVPDAVLKSEDFHITFRIFDEDGRSI